MIDTPLNGKGVPTVEAIDSQGKPGVLAKADIVPDNGPIYPPSAPQGGYKAADYYQKGY